jgi:hypothetical protein
MEFAEALWNDRRYWNRRLTPFATINNFGGNRWAFIFGCRKHYPFQFGVPLVALL